MGFYFLAGLLTSVAAYIVFYFLYGAGLYTMLKRCGFKKPVFAFVPFARDFALGSLADQHRDIFPPKNRGKKLMILSIVSFVFTAIHLVAYYRVISAPLSELITRINAFDAANLDVNELAAAFESFAIAIESAMTKTVSMLSSFASIASLAFSVYRCMVLIRVYNIFVPRMSFFFTILSIFVEEAAGIIFLCIRKKPLHNLRWQTENEPEIPRV